MNIDQDAVVIVLGATGNLGMACAEVFHKLGTRVVLVDRSDDRLQESFNEWDPDRHQLAGGVDLTEESALTDLVADVIERYGRLDAVVNTVGAFRGGQPVHADERETWDFLFDVNLTPAVLVARAVIPVMLRQGSGRIINIASRNAFRGTANYAAYSAAKAALVRLTESLADEVRTHGITVNCVVPGTIDTPQNRQAMPDADTSAWVSPAQLADVIAFLVAAESSAITGAAIPAFGRGPAM
jgi:NAD(P)-dependent dehydrogenase (short-subunit alcohol dehydrogenase family)